MNIPDSDIKRKVRQWISYGDADLRMARLGFSLGENAPFHIIAYHAQQAVEKYLKGYLVFFRIDFPYTHNLLRLVKLCPGNDEWKDIFPDLQQIIQYSVSSRYPGIDEEVTEQEALDAVEIASRAISMIRPALIKKGVEFSDEEPERGRAPSKG
jgi:HEPN domain-containing protein